MSQHRRLQIAALPVRFQRSDEPEILLITSRLRKRLLIPKGWPMKGKSNSESAAQEAFEEAGVRGSISPDAIGSYDYDNLRKSGKLLPCTVEVYLLEVQEQLDCWPEQDQRERIWVPLYEAAEIVAEPTLSRFLLESLHTVQRSRTVCNSAFQTGRS